MKSIVRMVILSAVFVVGSNGAEPFETVNIGDQVWMAENLNVRVANAPSWCYYNSEKSCESCGRLYTWAAALSACPSGWHLPNRQEWEKVSKYGGFSYKTCGYRAVDWYGVDQGFSYRGNTGAWWSSEENKKAWDGDEAYHWQVSTTGTGKLGEFPAPKGFGASVRCVKD
ncbi:MAG: hypothetical protein LBC59_00760 [Chitinispirillales bacterium]|jgi:hypothetical protein|nr:hypothetical protein [Chitinispirillales bacterium]